MKKFCFFAAVAAVSFSAFADLTPKAWNGGASGEWGVAANWEPAGVPTADDAVTIGSGAVTISGAAATAGSLTIASGAKLYFGCEGTDVTKMTPLADTDANDLLLTVAGDFALNGQFAVGGAEREGNSGVSVGGNLALGANAKFAVYAGFASTNENFEVWAEDGGTVAVGGKLTTAAGAWIYPFSHGTSGCSVRFTVAGDVEIAAGGGFDADMRGFKFPYGPGTTIRTGWNEGCGACYANYAYIHGGTKVTKTYGYKCAPFQSGSPGQASGNNAGAGAQGGGVIRIHAQGDMRLDGTLTANGGVSANGTSSGGSVWVTCDKFLRPGDAAKISVKGGSMSTGYNSGGGSGGRVAIMTGKPTAVQLEALYATGTCGDMRIVTEEVNDPLRYEYSNLIDLAGGTTQKSFGPAGAGTAVIMINLSGSATLTVGARPSLGDVEVPASSPEFGMTLVSGTIEATCESVRFVPNTDRRQRRLCVGYVYSNAVGTVVAGQGTSCTIAASDAAAHWLEWDYSDLEYRLHVTGASGGSVTGVEGLSAASPDSWYDFDAAASVSLAAVPDEGWRFLGWQGDVDAARLTDNPLALTMDKPRDVKAIFVMSAAPAELAALQDGEWFDATTWGGAGVPGRDTAVTLNGRKVVNTYPFAMQMRSLTLCGNAALKAWGTGTDATAMLPIGIQGEDASLEMTVVGDVAIADTAWLSLGGLNSRFVPKFTVGGSLVLLGNGKLAAYAGETPVDPDDVEKYVGDGAQVTVSNSLTLAGTSWVYPQCHTFLGGGVRWTVGGDVSIAANAGFDATARGYRPPNGPGYSLSTSTDGEGGSYGGLGGTGAGQLSSTRKGGLPYGYAKAPFMCGSAGRAVRVESTSTAGGIGGGSIRIHAGGKVTLAGKLLALPTLSSGSGAGGGVWVTCDEFVVGDGAKIDAHGLDTTYGWAGAGGGGRVAIMTGKPTAEQLASLYATGECENAKVVTTDVNNPKAWSYPNLIDIRGGDNSNNHECSMGHDGTAVVMANLGDRRTIAVDCTPDSSNLTLPAADPAFGVQLFDGTRTFRAITPVFVPGTDSRERRLCTGYTYTNDVGGSDSGTETEKAVTANDAESHFLTWHFGRLEKLLRVTADATVGSVTGLANDGWYENGATATLTAVPSDGWKFLCWGGELPLEQQRDNPLTLTMDRPRDVRAYFVTAEPVAELTAVQNGDWLDAATWGGLGVPSAETAVTVDGKTVTFADCSDLSVKSLALSGNAAANFFSTAVAGQTGVTKLVVADDLVLADDAALTVGAQDNSVNPAVSVGGDLSLSGKAKFSIYAGPVSQDDLAVYAAGGATVTAGRTMTFGSGTMVLPYCHSTNGASVAFSASDIIIEQGAKVDAVQKGFAAGYGPTLIPFGTPKKPANTDYNGIGSSHGGVCAMYQSDYPDVPTYGWELAPFWPGSPGGLPRSWKWDGAAGGGVINFSATKSIVVAGTLSADSSANASVLYAAGSGGSVWLRAKTVTIDSTARITAKTPDVTYGYACPSGGGRICVMEGRPPSEWMARLVRTGVGRGGEVICSDLASSDVLAASGLAELDGVFSAAAGQGKYTSYDFVRQATAGTAVWLKASAGGLIFVVR